MPSEEFHQSQADMNHGQSPIHCDDCQAALHSDNQQAVSFLLLDQLTIPLCSCDDHLEQFTSLCGLTTEDTATLLHHHPAGGICCPACRLAPYNSAQPRISLQEGAIAVIACPEHQAEVMNRFQTGLQTHQQLTSTLGTHTNSSL